MSNPYFDRLHSRVKEALRGLEERPSRLPHESTPDPTVERLLEGVTFIGSEIERLIDQTLPQHSIDLLEQFAPNFWRPIPSATVVSFVPSSKTFFKKALLPKETVMISDPIGPVQEEKVECRFVTVWDCPLYPLKIEDIHLKDPHTFEVILRVEDKLTWEALQLSDLTFYLSHDDAASQELYYFFARNLKSLSVELQGNQPSATFDQGFNLQRKAFPAVSNDSPFQTFKDYLSMGREFFFVTWHGFASIRFQGEVQRILLTFTFKEALSNTLPIHKNCLVLYAVPAVNLYSQLAEPFVLSEKQTEHPLYCDRRQQEGIQLHSVESVTGLSSLSSKRTIYHAFQKFEPGPQYQLWMQKNILGLRQPFLRFSLPEEAQTITCHLSVTNGDYPVAYLNSPFRVIASSALPQVSCFLNSPITPYVPLPDTSEYGWKILGSLIQGYRSLLDLESLKTLIECCDWSFNPQSLKRGLTKMEVKHSFKMHRGLVYPILNLQLLIDEKSFRGIAEIFCQSERLFSLFSSLTPINTLLEFRVVLRPSQKQFCWLSGNNE